MGERHVAERVMVEAIRAVIGGGVDMDQQGFTNREMAETRVVSAETIKTQLTNILGKFQARDRTHAALIGLRHSLASWN